MKKAGSIIAMLCCILAFVCGCTSSKNTTEGSFKIYYINQKQTALMPISYNPKSEETRELIKEVLDILMTPVEDSDHTCPISDPELLIDNNLRKGRLTLIFSGDYSNLSASKEALMRAAVVKSLIQIKGVDSVTFKVGDEVLTDQAGNVVGAMTDDSFVYDFGAEQDTLESAELVLYYSSVDAGALRKDIRRVHYNSNVPLEQVVLRYLSMTPQTVGAMSTISDSSVVLSVSTQDGICYVNLDDSVFSEQNVISRNIVIYSIVNSLCELDGVGQVEIMIGTGENASVVSAPDGSDLYQADPRLVREK